MKDDDEFAAVCVILAVVCVFLVAIVQTFVHTFPW